MGQTEISMKRNGNLALGIDAQAVINRGFKVAPMSDLGSLYDYLFLILSRATFGAAIQAVFRVQQAARWQFLRLTVSARDNGPLPACNASQWVVFQLRLICEMEVERGQKDMATYAVKVQF